MSFISYVHTMVCGISRMLIGPKEWLEEYICVTFPIASTVRYLGLNAVQTDVILSYTTETRRLVKILLQHGVTKTSHDISK